MGPLAFLVASFAAARFPRPEAAGTEGERPLGGKASAASTEAEGGGWALYRNGPLLLVAAIACLGLLAEGEMFQWSGIYLRDTLELAAVVGGSGVAVFYGAHALGRLAIGWLVGRAGNRRTLVGSIPEPHAHGYTLQGRATGEKPIDATDWSPSEAWTAGMMISTVDDMLVYGRSAPERDCSHPSSNPRGPARSSVMCRRSTSLR